MSRYFIGGRAAASIEIWANIFGALSGELAETAATFTASVVGNISRKFFQRGRQSNRPTVEHISLVARYNGSEGLEGGDSVARKGDIRGLGTCQTSVLLALISCAFVANMSGQ